MKGAGNGDISSEKKCPLIFSTPSGDNGGSFCAVGTTASTTSFCASGDAFLSWLVDVSYLNL